MISLVVGALFVKVAGSSIRLASNFVFDLCVGDVVSFNLSLGSIGAVLTQDTLVKFLFLSILDFFAAAIILLDIFVEGRLVGLSVTILKFDTISIFVVNASMSRSSTCTIAAGG